MKAIGQLLLLKERAKYSWNTRINKKGNRYKNLKIEYIPAERNFASTIPNLEKI